MRRMKVVTCALSPSYLNSQAKSALPSRFITSETPFVGCANIGLTGMPVKNEKRFYQQESIIGYLWTKFIIL